MNWRDKANCKGMDTRLFLPPRGEVLSEEAKLACEDCPVKEPCLQEALSRFAQIGYQGGQTAQARRRMVRLAS